MKEKKFYFAVGTIIWVVFVGKMKIKNIQLCCWDDLGGFHWEHEKYKIFNFAFGTIWVVVIGNMKIDNIKYSTLLLG